MTKRGKEFTKLVWEWNQDDDIQKENKILRILEEETFGLMTVGEVQGKLGEIVNVNCFSPPTSKELLCQSLFNYANYEELNSKEKRDVYKETILIILRLSTEACTLPEAYSNLALIK